MRFRNIKDFIYSDGNNRDLPDDYKASNNIPNMDDVLRQRENVRW